MAQNKSNKSVVLFGIRVLIENPSHHDVFPLNEYPNDEALKDDLLNSFGLIYDEDTNYLDISHDMFSKIFEVECGMEYNCFLYSVIKRDYETIQDVAQVIDSII